MTLGASNSSVWRPDPGGERPGNTWLGSADPVQRVGNAL